MFSQQQLKRPVKQTPPTPVQSLQDLTVLSSSSHSTSSSCQPKHQPPSSPSSSRRDAGTETHPTDAHFHVSASMGHLGGGAGDGGDAKLELKQSLCSPVHSKRSLSADTVKKLITSRLGNGQDDATRVISAGNRPKASSEALDKREKGTKGSRSERGRRSKPSGEPRKSSADLPFWKSEVAPLLSMLDSTPYKCVDQLCETCSSLWACLEGRGLLGWTGGKGGTRKRSVVLRTVFKLLDHKEPRLLLKVAKIIVAVSPVILSHHFEILVAVSPP